MHRRNKAISSSDSLLSGGSSTVLKCLSEEYEDHLQRSHEDFQPLPRIFTKSIFTHEEPRALYRHYQLKANQTPISMDKSNAWRLVVQDIKLSAAKSKRKKSKPCKFYKQSYRFKSQIYCRHAATTSKPKEVQDHTPEDNMYRYNRKGFLEDNDSNDDSIFIVDPGWDDYCLQELKLNRPVPCCPDARRARM
ncbi:hypothetical protein Tco_1230269 [Tanacetum coccineum]